MRINQKELDKLDKTEVTLEELLNAKCIKENFLEKKVRTFYMMSLRLIPVPNNDNWKRHVLVAIKGLLILAILANLVETLFNPKDTIAIIASFIIVMCMIIYVVYNITTYTEETFPTIDKIDKYISKSLFKHFYPTRVKLESKINKMLNSERGEDISILEYFTNIKVSPAKIINFSEYIKSKYTNPIDRNVTE